MRITLTCLLLSFFFCPLASAQERPVRFYDFEDTTLENRKAEHRTQGYQTTVVPPMLYKTDHPFEIVEGVKKGSKAVRLDRGYFEVEAPEIFGKTFCIEMIVRVLGPGTETGNNGSKNGTLFGMGDGYWSGLRYTIDTNNWNHGFALGRPQPSSAITAWTGRPFPVGKWVHLVAIWNGGEMIVYLDGLPWIFQTFSGPVTKPNGNFRVGFNAAGVGSVKMDVDQIAVYDGILPPMAVFQKALTMDSANSVLYDISVISRLREIVKGFHERDWEKISQRISEADWIQGTPVYRDVLEYLRGELLDRTGQPAQAVMTFAGLAASDTAPPLLKEIAVYRCVPMESVTPLVAGSPELYERLLDLPNLTEPQRKAVEKSLVLSTLLRDTTPDKLQAFQKSNGIEEYQELAESLIQRKFVRDYLAEEREELAAEQKRIAEGLSPWEPVAAKNPLEPKFNPTVRFEVAPGGSLLEARDKIRTLRLEQGLPAGGVEVIVRGGTYEMFETLELDAQDSGTEEAPIVYRNAEGESPVFLGSLPLKGFQKVTDSEILKRLPEQARAHVLQVNLADCGIEVGKLPPMRPRGFGANGPGAAPWVDLYVNDKPMQIARYPNYQGGRTADQTDFLWTGEIVTDPEAVVTTPGFALRDRSPGVFRYTDDRVELWRDAEDAWLFGYWGHLWAATSVAVQKIDTDKKEVTVITGANPYGYVKGAPFFAFNLLEELDIPGEWYLDRKSGVLYVYPPTGVTLDDSKVRLTILDKPFLRLRDVSHTTFLDLTFEDGGATGAIVEGGERVWFAGCKFHRFGAWGISMRGTRHGVLSCDVHQLGGGGVSMNGGNERTLTPGECFIENNHISDLTRVDRVYGPAVSLDGVGNRIAHNLMHNSPAHGMRMGGFENIVEFNEIHSVVYESDDQSGIDMFGNFAWRGNVIRYNYWHHIGNDRTVAGQSGIRLDDMICNILMYGNLFYKSADGQFGGIQVHGGKDNVSDNNLFIDCKSAFSFSPWGKNRWQEFLKDSFFAKMVRDTGVDITKEPHQSSYPDYAEIQENADRNFVFRNLAIDCGTFARNDRGQNVILNNLSFTEAVLPGGKIEFDAAGKPQIPYNWPVYKINKMRPLPIQKMGLYQDVLR